MKQVGRDIPTNILRKCNFPFSVLADCINRSFEPVTFPDCLKEANFTPIFKKDDPLYKQNYRPVGTLPLLSKVFEKLIYKHLSNYIESFFILLSSLLCAFGRRTLPNMLYSSYFIKAVSKRVCG